ncbi:MAG: tRNA epoxyqueuosine(34) reductase QueG [Candidatus Eremiobacteraeota bacterium]|nr:tRNA epoxyqueuosine(34) reductase QueG [Candidatus Eremiobacteraeota bacterium]
MIVAHEAAPGATKARIIEHAKSLGFDLVGVAPATPFLREQAIFKDRRDRGYLGQWRYDDATVERYCDPRATIAQARSIICTATSYLTADTPHDPNAPGLRGAVSSHAWGHDYHRTIHSRLLALAAHINQHHPEAASVACVDTGPLVDRAAAVRAGLGWFGKSGNVLTKQFGSYVLLGELITTLDLEPDRPLRTHCGNCRDCIPACPTDAIGPDGAVDSRRCISDLTQLKRPIPREFRAAIGNRLWGCDSCQTSCPVNAQKSAGGAEAFRPLEHIGTSMDLTAVLHMTKRQFREWFGPTSMAWRGKAVLQRNAAVALGNSRDERAIPHLILALRDRKPLVRGHAVWALGRFGTAAARAALENLLQTELDPWVREEAEQALRSGSIAS